MASKNEMKAILNIAKISQNEWVRDTELMQINFDRDGNHFYNFKTQKIFFDTVKDVIMIKYSELIPSSSLLYKFTYNDLNNTITVNSLGSVYSKKDIREPRVGDRIMAYDKRTKTYTQTLIKGISKKYQNTTYELNDTALINKIKSVNYGLTFFVLIIDDGTPFALTNDPCQFYYEHEPTENQADHYFGFDTVAGLNFIDPYGQNRGIK